MSKVPADWDEIMKVVKLRDKLAVDTVIIGNGDVKSYQEALVKHQEYGVEGIMIGRGIFHNPWVFEKDNKFYSPKEYKKVLLKHLKLYQKIYADKKDFNVMKKFFKMYINNFKGANEMRIKLMETNNYNEVYKLLK